MVNAKAKATVGVGGLIIGQDFRKLAIRRIESDDVKGFSEIIPTGCTDVSLDSVA